jgi:hypothetical protein
MPNWKWSLKSTTRRDYSSLHLLFLKNPLTALSTFSFSCDSLSCRLVTRCTARALSSRQLVLACAIVSMASALATDNLSNSFSAMHGIKDGTRIRDIKWIFIPYNTQDGLQIRSGPAWSNKSFETEWFNAYSIFNHSLFCTTRARIPWTIMTIIIERIRSKPTDLDGRDVSFLIVM